MRGQDCGSFVLARLARATGVHVHLAASGLADIEIGAA